MVTEVTSDVFGNPLTLRMGTPLGTGHLRVSVIGNRGDAWSNVFTYDPAAHVMETDGTKLESIINGYRSTSNAVLGTLITISDVIVGIINGMAGVIKGVLGSFVGFGLIGIMFVLMMLVLSLMVSIYAFIFAAPLLAISYGLRFYKNGQMKDEAQKLQRAAFGLFEDGGDVPAIADRSQMVPEEAPA
jgi:hypothetical protein